MWMGVMRFLGSILSFLGDAFRYVGVFIAYRLGIRKERQQQVEKRLEQDNAAARLKRDAVIDDNFRKRLHDKYVKR